MWVVKSADTRSISLSNFAFQNNKEKKICVNNKVESKLNIQQGSCETKLTETPIIITCNIYKIAKFQNKRQNF